MRVAEALDDDLLLAEQLVDHESDPAAILGDLVAVWREGRRRLVSFEPEPSLAFLEASRRDSDSDYVRSQAVTLLRKAAEDDEMLRLAYPVAESFAEDAEGPWGMVTLARRLLEPMVAARAIDRGPEAP